MGDKSLVTSWTDSYLGRRAEDVNASEFFNQFDFEHVPVGDVVEGSSLVCWDGLKGDEEPSIVGALGEVVTVQGEGQRHG